jgi:plasmid stabilization system protein ParE
MTARVRIHPDVVASLKEQLDWIREHRDESWARRLREDLDQAFDALAEFPFLGPRAEDEEHVAGDGASLRRLPLRRTPFVLRYAVDEARGEVWVLRLFHSRQSRARRRRR